MSRKNNLPPAQGFGSGSSGSKQPADDPYRICLSCGMKLIDNNMPRGAVIEHGMVIGVECISCCEADEEAIKFGSPNNPLLGDDW